MIQEKHQYNDYGTDYPNSRKVYVTGSRPDLKVPMREIKLTDTRRADGSIEENPPILAYDTSGPMTDPSFTLDLEKGLPKLRAAWVEERGDTDLIDARGYQPGDDGQGLSLIHISEPTRQDTRSRMPSSA